MRTRAYMQEKLQMPITLAVSLPMASYVGDKYGFQHTFKFGLWFSTGVEIRVDEEDIPPKLRRKIEALAFKFLLSILIIDEVKATQKLRKKTKFSIGDRQTIQVQIKPF